MLPELSGPEFVRAITGLGVSHVVWLPDSATGRWERALEDSRAIRLVRVCREGEAWAVAGGLVLGGARPLVVIQNTGLFESGDALRNILHDLRLPLYALIGYRSYLVDGSTDTAKQFTEPVLRAWGLDYQLLDPHDPLPQFVRHFEQCRAEGRPGCSLLPEGRP
jgi:sulfopyruvate decarboxylase TPP-binding subunit